MSLGVFLRVWKRVCAGRPPPGFKVLHLSLPALPPRRRRQLIRAIKVTAGLDSSSRTARESLAHFFDSAVAQKRSTCWNNAGRAPVLSSVSLLFSLKPKARCDCATETFCSSPSTRAHSDSKKER